MSKFSIPAFVEELAPDTENAKYSRAKLKMYYVGETVDKRLFTKEFSDKLISTIAYTPVVGFYSIADEDFIGHNNVQHIYGLVPADATVEYVEDTDRGVTFAVTDILLYTGRPDEIGTIASKIVGKQHSLELDPHTVKYKINRDSAGNFKNLEFTEGELIGLSVLGDNDTPAFSGSEFFSASELPEFITEENKSKYQALFNAMFSVEPTAEEVITEIYKTMDAQRIYGYICEHIADKYVVINTDYGVYSRYLCERTEEGYLQLAFDCNVRQRYLSDAELESLGNAQKGSTQNFDDTTAQDNVVVGTETTTGSDSSASIDGEENTTFEEGSVTNDTVEQNAELEALRSNCDRLERENADLTEARAAAEASLADAQSTYENNVQVFKRGILQGYSNLLSEEVIAEFEANFNTMTIEEFINGLADAHHKIKESIEADIIEISTIDTSFISYDEKDEAAVVQKYLKR